MLRGFYFLRRINAQLTSVSKMDSVLRSFVKEAP